MTGQGYNFKPMMPLYARFMGADVKWLESSDGRRLLAKTVMHCRRTHGRQAARDFMDALLYVGVYPCFAGRF